MYILFFIINVVMTSSKDYLEYVLELLREVDNVTYKKMMGEYILYQNGVIFGGIYDNRFLVKKTKSVSSLGFKEQIPYPTGKVMLLVDIEDPDEIKAVVESIIKDLK